LGIFDKGVEPQEFESFKKAVSSRFDELERKVVSSTSESAEAARESLAAIQAHRLTVDHTAAEMSSARSEISEALQEISNAMSSLTSGKERFLEDASTLEQSARAALNVYAEASAANESVQRSVSEAQARLEKVDGFLEQADAIPTELEALSKQSQDAKSQADNIKLLLNHSLKRKGSSRISVEHWLTNGTLEA
jgi:chromosome segregation ATPase